MEAIEILTVIVGLLMTILGGYQYEGKAKSELITCLFVNLLLKTIYGLMVLLPLYFNYWRK